MINTHEAAITNIETKTAKNGSEYWTIHFGDKKYNTFDSVLASFKVGTYVEYKLTKNKNGFDTLLDMREIEAKSNGSQEDTQSSDHQSFSSEYHLTIEQSRSNALACAIEWLKYCETKEQSVLIEVAKIFEDYIVDGH